MYAKTSFKNLYNEDSDFEQTFLKIKKIILCSNNLSLSYYANESVINDLSLIITEFLIGVNDKEIVMDNIKQQKDLEGMFSLVRKGLIKKIQLADGRYIVTKRNNPEKGQI